MISSAVCANLGPDVFAEKEHFSPDAFGGVAVVTRFFGGDGSAASDDLGGVSALHRFFGGVGSLAAVAALIGFGGGDGGSATAVWV